MRNQWPQTLAVILTGLWLGSASAVTAAPASLGTCLSNCNAANLKPDDKATCKLECRYHFDEASPSPTPTPTPTPTTTVAPTPAPTPTPPAFDLAGCESRCTVHMLDTDRATCRLQCRNQAESYRAAAPAPTPAPTTGFTGTGAPAGYTPTGVTGPGGAMTYSPTASAPGATQPAPSAASQQQLQACVAECNRLSHRTSTDRETCKLNCNNLVEAWAPSTVYYGPGTAGANTREAVINSSAGVAGTAAYPTTQAYWSAPVSPAPAPAVATSPSPPAASSTTMTSAASPGANTCIAAAQQCTQGCTNEVSACYRECSATKGPATDKETCRLLCDSNREVCGQVCQAKSTTCNNNRIAAPQATR